jgi:hypothetical protein
MVWRGVIKMMVREARISSEMEKPTLIFEPVFALLKTG